MGDRPRAGRRRGQARTSASTCRLQPRGPLGRAAADGDPSRPRRGHDRRAGRAGRLAPAGLLRPHAPARAARRGAATATSHAAHVRTCAARWPSPGATCCPRQRELAADGAARGRPAAVPRHRPRLGGDRRLERAQAPVPAARPRAAAPPADATRRSCSRAAPRGRRRRAGGLLRRHGHPHERQRRPRRPRPGRRLARLQPAEVPVRGRPGAQPPLRRRARGRSPTATRTPYAEGRRRWAAYEDEVLHARLASVPDVREPMREREVASTRSR